jgi:HlyD family secretion protein
VKNKPCLHKAILVAVGFVAILTAACSNRAQGSASYEFANVRRSTLERTVSASGTIKPVSTVNVLPRMSGRVETIYVDFNDPVAKGDTLAELNTDVLKLKREQQHASVIKVRANYELQKINYNNQLALAERDLISEFELKTSKAELDGLAADLAVAESNLQVAETEITEYAYITSPIDGIVLDRKISVGDTVVDSSSSNSSALFTLAENLQEMQIEALVGELDITAIHKGQQVRFSLESLTGRSFSGEVETVRMVPVVSNNVVSYTVIINVENQDGSLLPGMTCAVDFIVAQANDVLVVPNAALRYQPTSLDEQRIADMVFNASLVGMNDEERKAAIAARTQAQNAEGNTNAASGGITTLVMRVPPPPPPPGGRRMNRPPPNRSGSENRNAHPVVIRNLWYLNDDGRLEVMQVQAGITNGSFTEIDTMEDIEGKQIILRERVL